MKVKTNKIFLVFDSNCDACGCKIQGKKNKQGYLFVSISSILNTGEPTCQACGSYAAGYDYAKIKGETK